jgi:hypothetical protein
VASSLIIIHLWLSICGLRTLDLEKSEPLGCRCVNDFRVNDRPKSGADAIKLFEIRNLHFPAISLCVRTA